MTSFPIELDTKIAAHLSVLRKAESKLAFATYSLRKAAGQSQDWKSKVWTGGTLEDAIIKVSVAQWNQPHNEFVAARADYEAAVATDKALQAQYTGWNRFFLVQNNNGHIHRTMSCSTCFVDTSFAWLPTVSGLTEAEAVAEHGEILCSVCFPSAPVTWTNGTSTVDKAAKAKRAAEKAEREAKKAAKALGVRIKGRWQTVETVVQAKTYLTDAAEWRNLTSYPPETVQQVAEALAAKLGTTADAEIEAAAKRAAKRK